MGTHRVASRTLALSLACLAGCGGGAGSPHEAPHDQASASEPSPSSPPTVVAASFARLAGDTSLGPAAPTQPVALDLAALADPLAPVVPIVPRDAALVLALDGDLAHDDAMLATLSVVTADGTPVPHQAAWLGGQLVLSGATDATRGWPAGGVVLDALGRSTPDTARALTLRAQVGDAGASVALLSFLPGARGLDVPGLADDELAPEIATQRGGWLPGNAAPFLARVSHGRSIPLRADTDSRAALRVFDEHGAERLDAWDAEAGHFAAIPPRSVLALSFDLPVDDELVRTYESVLVREADATPDALADGRALRPGVASLSVDGRTLTFVPRLADGSFVGFGGSPATLQLVLRGIVGDELVIPFETLAGSGPDYGVVVHDFAGTAQIVPDQGITYAGAPPRDSDGDGVPDARGTYGPSLLDLGLDAPGFLTGAPKRAIEHLIDDFNAPQPSAFASPNGEDFLISVGFGLSAPFDAPFGARSQQIWRAGDASPAQLDFQGVQLDLVGMAWSPYGTVQDQTLDSVELLVGVSGANRGRGPNTNQTSGIPDDQNSGLLQQFDCNLLEWNDVCCENAVISALQPFADAQPHQTTVVSAGTSYTLRDSDLFTPANAVGSSFNEYLSYPQFDAGVDPFFGRDDVHAFPYDSRFPMLFEMRVAPGSTPTTFANAARFSPGILTSALPRFRAFSFGQHPLAACVPNYGPLTVSGFGNPNYLRGGEGGPLVQPGTIGAPILPPLPNNGMPTIPPAAYILPPRQDCQSLQPEPDWISGKVNLDTTDPHFQCITELPTCNSDPYANWYFASGMLPRPFPNLDAYPGPTAPTPTFWTGYGLPEEAGAPGAATPCLLDSDLQVSQQPGTPPVMPSYFANPARYGDNARYYSMWKYSKRVSIVTSSAAIARRGVAKVHWLAPTLDPPLDVARLQGDLRVEFRAASGSNADLALSDSGWLDLEQDGLPADLTGDGSNLWIAFRAIFGTAPDASRPPKIDLVAMPFAY